MKMGTAVKQRFEELRQRGEDLDGVIERITHPPQSRFVHSSPTLDQLESVYADFNAWGLSVLSLLHIVFGEDSVHYQEFYKHFRDRPVHNVSANTFRNCWKIFQSAWEDYDLSVKEESLSFGASAKKHEEQVKAKEQSNKVFIVHGHDQALLYQTARFLEQLGLEPIILFEQPGKSRTIIEKLEQFGSVCFAVVLLTPDDVGKAINEGNSQPRARQNVVLELGYFLGKLGRSNVAALYQESVELPSDYRGVEYIKVDVEGAWKTKLARELKAAELPVDMNKAI